jgi:small subunit ribosomal protein S28e
MPVAAEVIQIRGQLGVKGVKAVRCRIVEGDDKGKMIVRNVVGPLKEGDVIVIKETGMDTESGMSRR